MAKLSHKAKLNIQDCYDSNGNIIRPYYTKQTGSGGSNKVKNHVPVLEQLKALIQLLPNNGFYRSLLVTSKKNKLSQKQRQCILNDYNTKIRFAKLKKKK